MISLRSIEMHKESKVAEPLMISKEDVKEVGTNYECGISLTSQDDIKVGDIIETFVQVEVKQKL